MHWYFAYGSNMNPERVTERGIRFDRAIGGRVSGFRLQFDKLSREGAGHANIVYDPTTAVEGVLYRLTHIDEIVKMDPFERAPINYSRDIVAVHSEDGTVHAWTYFANAAVRRDGLHPPEWYMGHLLAGEPFLSEDYVAWLRSLPCVATRQ